jgi:uncharacterized protein
VVGLAGISHAAMRIEVPKPQGYVSDFAGVIDPGTRTKLDALIGELKRQTGAEIAVVTVKSTQPDAAFDYAMAIAESWKPGTPGKDNGVVFLVAVADRQMQILTGYGVEGPLPDGKIGEIRDTIVKPAFRQGDFSGGISRATVALATAIAADEGKTLQLGGLPPPPPHRSSSGTGGLLLFLIIMVLFAVLNSSARGVRGVRRRPWIGGPMVGPWIGGGGFGGGFGGSSGGFGGFGGGRFGGGGAGGSW